MFKVNTSVVLFSLGMIFAGATNAEEVKLVPITDSEILTWMCGDKNNAMYDERTNNRALYDWKYSEYAFGLEQAISNKHLNSCVVYMASHSVDGAAAEKAGLDVDVAGMNDKALQVWVDGYKDTMRADYKELRQKIAEYDELHQAAKAAGVSPAELQYRRDQEEAGKKVAAEATHKERKGSKEEVSFHLLQDLDYCNGMYSTASFYKKNDSKHVNEARTQSYEISLMASNMAVNNPDREADYSQGVRHAKMAFDKNNQRAIDHLRSTCKGVRMDYEELKSNGKINVKK